MLNDDLIEKVIEKVLSQLGETSANATVAQVSAAYGEGLPDITEQELSSIYYVPNPKNREAIMNLKKATPARIGVWRAGPRYLTVTSLRFLADHAAAQDAVFNEVPESFVKGLNLFEVKTQCRDKDEYLTRPDLGRKLRDEAVAILKEKCVQSPQAQIIIADGLSSTACVANCKDLMPVLVNGLKSKGFKVGTPFFVRYGRVGVMDHIAEVLRAEAVVILIGERPGLITAESMSAYMAYKPTRGMSEAGRSVLSNIHKDGTPIVEAGAYVVDLIKFMLEKKASGTALAKLM
ncbi:MAG: ethanolamine ammonia-lyase subunit EutC [Syntrophaceae bacterium]|nr:ethanolamine ammonia-lyase subunit EutC [Syntrophaceae bacterium]